ncbi:HXXEE domain-containing protein [Ancylobacter oerskovii]|uniref:HXXEE domain-containing protein n=1 Tax=Ancylobacter oerskovii TaxID=459519 RepID=A0ABW4Z1N9_9HYPH|nr:HXXEE domain-containing protein [Ancylobacter oerskovii]MBS7544915.1 HXXEE domain-containing protein [Ancylobacter oerskovii]
MDRHLIRAVVYWLAGHWVSGAGFMAAALLALAPLLAQVLEPPLLLVFLHGPVYMLHQIEEHAGDRFRRFVNTRLLHDPDGLTVAAVLVVNLPLVWGVNLAALYAAVLCGPAAGLVAPYAMIVNAVIHLAAALRLRSYNPGLVTALLLFLPLGLATLAAVGMQAGIAAHLGGLALAVLLHALIVVHVARRLRGRRATAK